MPTIPNLCGASPELDDTLTKLEDLESDLTAKIDAVASEAAAAAEAAVTEMKAALDGLALDLPELPPLNLQAEITSLLALPKTNIGEVLAYTSKLANIETNFGSELTSSGKSLTTLVTDATSALSGGGDLCAAVPNFEKAADGGTPAVEKAAAVLQASVPPLAEELSKIVANPNVVATVAALKEKTEKFATTANTEGFKGLGAAAAEFTPAAAQVETKKSKEVTVSYKGKSITKKVVTSKESVVVTEVTGGGTTTRERANVSPFGFSNHPKRLWENVKGPDPDAFGDGLISSGSDGYDTVKLKHEPTKVYSIRAWSLTARSDGGARWVTIYEARDDGSRAHDSDTRDTFELLNNGTIEISSNFRGPYSKYAGSKNRYKDVIYRVRYEYNDTYDPNIKKHEDGDW